MAVHYHHSCAMGSLIYQYDGRIADPNKFPPQTDSVWIVGDYNSTVPTVPTQALSSQIWSSLTAANSPTINAIVDMQEGPDGEAYILNLDCTSNIAESGRTNRDSCTSVVKIDYVGPACSNTSSHPAVSVAQPITHGGVNWLMIGSQSFSILSDGPHTIEIPDTRSRVLESMRGEGHQSYRISNLPHNAVFHLRAQTEQGAAFRGFFHY